MSKYYPPYRGGIEDVCYNIVNSISGFEQKVVCFNNSKHTHLSNVEGVEVIRAGVVGEVVSQPISFSFLCVLRKCIKSFKPNIIHLHLPNPLVSLYILMLIPKTVKLILHWHSDIVAQKKLYNFFVPIERNLLNRANQIIVTSPNYLIDSIPLLDYRDKSIVIPNVISLAKMEVDESTNNKVSDLLSMYSGRKIVFFMGRHVPYKGIEYLIEAEKNIESSCVILIAGQGPLTKELKLQSKSERIVFLGRISDDDIKVYMNAATVFAFPSITKNEAFGVVLAEAMFCRAVPVTFTIKGSGVNWVSMKNITGMEVENGNAREFGQAIDILLKNDSLCLLMAENGYKRVMDNFTMDTIKAKLEYVYSLI